MRTINSLIFLLLLSISLQGQLALAAGPNLIQNPSLESASGNAPSQWSPITWGSVAATFSYPVVGRTGNAAELTLPSNTTGDSRWAHQPVAVDSGAVYEFKSWYKSTMPTEIDTKFIAADGSVVWGWVTSLPSSGGVWKQVAADITMPASAKQVVVFHVTTQPGTLTVDDYSLAKKDGTVPPPPPPADTFSEGMVTFSFDDAWTSQYTNALPVLQKAGIKGTYYILTGAVKDGWAGYMTPAQVKDIANKGHEIGGHTVTHADLTTLSTAAIDTEMRSSKNYLKNLTGKTVSTLAYPYGAYNSTVINRTKAAGYTSGRTAGTATSNGFNTKKQNVYEIKSFSPTNTVSLASMKAAIDRAKANKEWLVLSFHRVENGGGEYFTSTSDFQALVDYVKGSGVKTVTMQQGVALMQQ